MKTHKRSVLQFMLKKKEKQQQQHWNTVLIFDADAIVTATGSKRSVINVAGHIRAIPATDRRLGY